uniref:Uncharacterized protein n=1 Tax=Takifugu rubripes TaxID=31033 RepID=A0A3B5JVW6_TAKRU
TSSRSSSFRLKLEETVQRCREDEERRTEMASHFQAKLTDIQAQIEQHSARNDKLCRENANLTDKLELLVNQSEVRDEVRGEGREGVSSTSFRGR